MMETNTTSNGGFWMMIEEPMEVLIVQTISEAVENELQSDWQEYYPDFSF